MSTSYNKKAAVNLEVSLVYFELYAITNHTLFVPSGAPRKCVKSKFSCSSKRFIFH